MRYLASLLFLLPISAFANNPWHEHYASRDAGTTSAKVAALPAELPEVAQSIDHARQHAGLEYRITKAEAEHAIALALQADGAGEEISATLVKADSEEAILAHRSPLTFEISDVSYNARELSFEVRLYPFDGIRPLPPIQLSGRYDEVMEIPVLTRRLRRDDVITDGDIKLMQIPASRLRKDVALSRGDMVGKTPLRTISPNRPIRQAELSNPPVIRKNEQITLQFISGSLKIRTLGEALEDGAKGELIRVRNTDSHQPVQARILASGLAEVMPLGVLAQAGGNY